MDSLRQTHHRLIKQLSCLALLLLFADLCFSQELGNQSLKDLQESPSGMRIIQLTDHVNQRNVNQRNADTVELLQDLFAPEFIERNGVERLQRLFEDIRDNDGQWEIYEAERVDRFKYQLKAKGTKHGEWLSITIRTQDKEPFRIQAIDGIEFTPIGSDIAEPMLAPQQPRKFQRRQPVVTKERLQEFDVWLDEQVKLNQFSGVVVLALDFEPVFEKALGMANKRYQVPNQIDTRFRLASVNKIFTATAVLQLVEQGKISLDDKLNDYLDGFSDPSVSKVTIRHLLSHSSGWGAYWEHPEFLRRQYELRSVNDYMKFIKLMPLDFEPGERTQYSNIGYEVLGALIEKTTGQSYYEYMEKNIFEPAGMNSTSSPAIDEVAEGLATGYTNLNSSGQRSGNGYPYENIFTCAPRGTPAGGGCSTAPDLLRFLEVVATEKILTRESIEFLRRDSGVRTQATPFIFHNGGAPGQSAWMQTDLDNGYSVIVLANMDPEAGMKVVQKMSELFDLPMWR